MGWLMFCDQQDSHFLGGMLAGQAQGQGDPGAEAPLARGSVQIETKLAAGDRPATILGVQRVYPHRFSFTLHSVPGGGIAVVVSRRDAVFHAALDHDAQGRADILRVTYSWDLEAKVARFSVERPDVGKVYQTVLRDPIGLSLADIRELANNRAQRIVSADVSFCAVSNRIEPIGPMPGLTADTPILTPAGYLPAGEIKRGDIVTTLENGDSPVLGVVRHTVPARGLFEPVRLRAPYFHLQQDLVVAPGQRLVIGGSRVEYLFGAEHVLAPARHLINGSAAVRERGHALVTYVHLLLPDHEAIIAAGTFVESLNIARLRRRPEVLSASLLAQFARNDLPEHSRTVCPVLRPFEAITLAEQRAA